jgi:carboxymethylenebutenolidase
MAIDLPAAHDRVTSEAAELGRFHRALLGTGRSAPTLPGLVLIHDVWGLSEHSEALSTALAAAGFAVLEIDLYRLLGDFVIEEPGPHIRSLSDPSVLGDLDAGAEWLAEQEVCSGRKIGVMGVCMGGTFAALAACHSERFAASAPFYGILSYDEGILADPGARNRQKKPSSPIEAAGELRMPILASFGRDDELVPDSDVDAFEAGLATSGVSYQIERYDGAGHAFLNQTRTEAYRPDVAARAWGRVIPFLHGALD